MNSDSNTLPNLSAWIYFRIWAYFVASDMGVKDQKPTLADGQK